MLIVLATGLMVWWPSQSTVPIVRAVGEPVVGTQSTNSPHWAHINIADNGRAVKYLPYGTVRNAGYEWYARHVDMTEVAMDDAVRDYQEDLESNIEKALNPTMKTYGYTNDIEICQHLGCEYSYGPNAAEASLPEDQYLHFSEDTQVSFRNKDGVIEGTVNITGCPEPDPITSACRMQVFRWYDSRWVPNLKNTDWQTWKADQLIYQMTHNGDAEATDIDGLFLDEHGPGASLGWAIGLDTIIDSGGGVREYGGLRPKNYNDQSFSQLDEEYNADVVTWLTYLRSRLDAVNKFALINTAEYFMGDYAFAQNLAAGGAFTELLHSVVSFKQSATQYQEYIDKVHQMTTNGGILELTNTPCVYEPDGFGASNYATARDRYQMWDLASYYMVRELPSESGRAYFDPNLCITLSNPNPLDFEDQWLPAYEIDVGTPQDYATVIQTGPQACSGSTPYSIFKRQYSNATILVRPRGGFACSDYSDATAASVTLDAPMVILQADGTHSGAVSTVSLNNGDAVILFPAPDTTAPAAVTDLRTD